MSFFTKLRGKSTVDKTGTPPTPRGKADPSQQETSNNAAGGSATTSPKNSVPPLAPIPARESSPADANPPPSPRRTTQSSPRRRSTERRTLSPDRTGDENNRLKEEIKSLQQQLQQKCQEYVDHMHSINEDLAAKDRALKRAESLAREATRAREKQIVSSSADVTKLRNDLAVAQDKIVTLEKSLVEEDTKYQSILMKLREEEQNVLAVKSQTQMMLGSRSNLISELTKTAEDLKQQNLALKAQLTQTEKKLIASVATAQSKESELLAMRVALESERRLAQARSRAAAKKTGDGSAPAVGEGSTVPEEFDATTQREQAAATVGSPDPHVVEAVRNENVLRAKDKQIVLLTNELIQLRSDHKLLQLAASSSSDETLEATKKLSVVTASLAEARQQLSVACQQLEHKSATNAELRRIKVEQEEEIVALQQVVSGMEIEAERLRAIEQFHVEFVGQHTNCHATMSEGALKIMKLQGELKDVRESLARASKERDAALESARDAQNEKTVYKDSKEIEFHPMRVRIEALENDLDNALTSVEELENELKERDAAYAKLAADLSAVTAQRDEERELWRQRTTQNAETLAQHVASAKAQVQSQAAREAELVKQVEALSQEKAELQLANRQLEVSARQRRDSTISDSAANERRTSALQRMSLELEEMKQKYSKLQREVQTKKEEVEKMRDRLCEAEGSVDQSSTSASKIAVGMLESLSVEVSSQLADHLRLDYLRGGKNSAAMMVRTFNLMQDQAQTLVEVLCELFLRVKVGQGLEEICKSLGVKENSIRRVVTAFSKVEQRLVASPRHELLIRDTPPSRRTTYCGQERLSFLCVANRGECSLACLVDQPYLLAKICAFLPMVIRGSNTFAAHCLTKRSQGDLLGSTILLCLDPADRTFKMLECEVSSHRTLMVIVDGKYKAQLSPNSMSNVKLMIQCRMKRDAVLVQNKKDDSYQWDFGKEEAIPKNEADIITYTLKWELNHDGLVAETSTVKLREVSAAEVGMLQELYVGDLSPSQMLNHRSWELIPPPPTGQPSSPSTGAKGPKF
jgi:hypothetical protein